MGSAVFSASVAAQTVFTAPENKPVYITQVIIDNVMEGVNDITITLRDSFTADGTHGLAAPAATTVEKIKFSALKTNKETLPDNVAHVKFLNTCQLVCDVAAANTIITVIWE